MRNIYPDHPDCPPDIKKHIEEKYGNRDRIRQSDQDAINRSNRQRVDAFLEGTDLRSLVEMVTAKDYIEFLRIHIDIIDHEAKL